MGCELLQSIAFKEEHFDLDTGEFIKTGIVAMWRAV